MEPTAETAEKAKRAFLQHARLGFYDEELKEIFDRLNQRARVAANGRADQVRSELEIGSRVRFRPSKPKYLTGLAGEVIELRDNRALVMLDQGPTGKFRSGRVLATYAGLEVI